ncbi:MAG: UDP-4-amino-4-deoxy-L-arabinose--oxoglutarate aminotransferase [Bacteroidia bacterium]|nr:UDP-4-amino-4-deoxy-L-arabinose--oxoglutarate aminotransferase [Bacteroidia bacterium]
MIPFSPPRIDQLIIDEVTAALKSGWITTGPRTKKFEKELAAFCGVNSVLCLNSATAGLELVLRWFGVKEGDEVIVPAYTYCATANVVMHCGAKPVMVDINETDFNISLEKIRAAVTPKTKVIMPVDFGGLPCNYDAINALVNEKEIKNKFQPVTDEQDKLARILILSDAAHSLGAVYKNKPCGSLTDVTVFSFHAVKNLTTAEGGAIAFNLPAPFQNEKIYQQLVVKSLHGQNKDALAKTQKGNWKYDVVEAGYKCNMTDLQAAIGLIELTRYKNDTLKKRKEICSLYSKLLLNCNWAELPLFKTDYSESSYHLFPLRIKGINEKQRDEIIQEIFNKDVSVNVHFQPLPLLTYYKNLGYRIENYPAAYNNYSREISLPVYYDLTDEQVKTVANAVITSVDLILKK